MSAQEEAGLRRAVDAVGQPPRKTSSDPAAPAPPSTIDSAAAAVEAFLGGGEEAPEPSPERPTNPATRMFAAWSGQDPKRVGRDPQALLAGLRAVGEDVCEIMRDAVSGDPARHARAEARLAELKRLQAEAGLAGDAAPERGGAAGRDDDPDSPNARFRGRLQTILEDAVGRLERLKTEVEAARPGAKGASEDGAAPQTGEREGEKRP
jgi:hypothetical protein